MNPIIIRALIVLLPIAAGTSGLCEESLLTKAPVPGDFVIVRDRDIADILVDRSEPRAVRRAAEDLASDVARVTGRKPQLLAAPEDSHGDVIMVGVLGSDPLIDRLAAEGKIDVRGIAGAWEGAVIQNVRNPMPGIGNALVVAGSDRRGAIYGAYWISESIGVSPWYWWADVSIPRQSTLAIAGGVHWLRPPAVQYRGIFLNDEDWGLRPWASEGLDAGVGNIGPNTYAKVFELILRLRGNLLWPAMHPGTRAFNFYPANKALADDYGIVLGSSHAEPMLRDNVDEWARDGKGDYDYATNSANVLQYWADRVRQNSAYENLYTLGMRGIHDGPMQGGGSEEVRIDRLRRIIGDQRELLRRYVNAYVSSVPQLFCPYKEVLPLYQAAPQIVPDDVALLWPDDDYGYIQHFSNEAERRRHGGAGVYYHVSYWGRPYDYLWLCSTPPALIGEEMTKAYGANARRIWIVNVGDLKPAEWDMEFFLRLAWNPGSWTPARGQHTFYLEIARRDLGDANAEKIASMMDEYCRLNFQRKPEHMGLDVSNSLLSQPVFSVDCDGDEAARRLDAFEVLRSEADSLRGEMDSDHAEAYYELVLYPIRAAELMNKKWLSLSRFDSYVRQGRATASRYLAEAVAAQAAITMETEAYNRRLADGKWKGIMSDTPRELPVFYLPSRSAPPVPQGRVLGLKLENSTKTYRSDRAVDLQEGMAMPKFTSRVPLRHFIDVFDVGQTPVAWTMRSHEGWIRIDPSSGVGDRRVTVSIDWNSAPSGKSLCGTIQVAGAGAEVDVAVPVQVGTGEEHSERIDFAEADSRLVIEAAHPSRRRPGGAIKWQTIQGLGYNGTAEVAIATGLEPEANESDAQRGGELEYRIWIDTPGQWNVVARLLPTWPLSAGRLGRIYASFDASQPQAMELPSFGGENDPQWQQDVLRNSVFSSFKATLSRGAHLLRISAGTPGIVLDSLMLEADGASNPGYVWPAETKVANGSP